MFSLFAVPIYTPMSGIAMSVSGWILILALMLLVVGAIYVTLFSVGPDAAPVQPEKTHSGPAVSRSKDESSHMPHAA